MARRAKPPAPTPTIGPEPPEYKRGAGVERFKKTEPIITVALDAGAFEWLWSIVEARAKSTTYEWHTEYRDLVSRAQRSFYDAVAPEPETTPDPPVRRIKRRGYRSA